MALTHFRGRNGLLSAFVPDESSERRRHLPVERPAYSSA